MYALIQGLQTADSKLVPALAKLGERFPEAAEFARGLAQLVEEAQQVVDDSKNLPGPC